MPTYRQPEEYLQLSERPVTPDFHRPPSPDLVSQDELEKMWKALPKKKEEKKGSSRPRTPTFNRPVSPDILSTADLNKLSSELKQKNRKEEQALDAAEKKRDTALKPYLEFYQQELKSHEK